MIKRLSFLVLSIAVAGGLQAQDDEVPVLKEDVQLLIDDTVFTEPSKVEQFVIVDSMPEYPGGKDAMMEYLRTNLKYPTEAKEEGVTGKVWIQFVVDVDGKVVDAKVMRSLGHGCDEEAIRVVNEMPQWKPGMAKGKPARVQFTLPIRFSLTSPEEEREEEK